jgi:predicted TIM-barrel fold metal-dependent hydrolase
VRIGLAAALVAFLSASPAVGQGAGKPIIDMHMHAYSLTEFGPEPPKACAGAQGIAFNGYDPATPFTFEGLGSCKTMLTAPATDEALVAETLATMKRHNIVAGVLSGDRPIVAKWRAAAPERFLPAAHFFTDENPPPAAYAIELEKAVAAGELKLFAEITAQYRGLAPDHPSLEPFYAVAERLDVPVGIHMGYGAPGGPYWIYPKYRASLGNPLLLEELLVRHPRLRVYIMHAAMPMVDELLMVLNAHPQVYVDISADNWGVPRAEFHAILKRIVEAGYGRRIMFGSDQMVWPKAIDLAVASISEAHFLSAEQKRDIFYNNAARFLRLSPEQVARDHQR